MSRLVAYSGTHGTGKTTAAFNSALDFKYNNPDKSVHILVNQEALCPYPINQQATVESQLWLFTNKIEQELTVLKRFDIVVTDRTIIDIIAYTSYLGYESTVMTMLEVARNYMPKYHQISVKKIINNDYCYPDGIRDTQDYYFRRQIETLIISYYQELADNPGQIKYV